MRRSRSKKTKAPPSRIAMPIKYDQFTAIYPPRPKGAINPAMVSKFSGFIAQYKYNDWRTVIYLLPDGRIELFNRHKKPHTAYRLTSAMKSAIQSLKLPLGK